MNLFPCVSNVFKHCLIYALLRVSLSDVAVESFFPHSYTGIQTTQYLSTYRFFDKAYRTQISLFDHIIDIRDESVRQESYDGLFTSQLKKNKLKFLTQFGDNLQSCCVNFWLSYLDRFKKSSISRSEGILALFIHFCV